MGLENLKSIFTGENKFSGTGKELLNDPEVRRSFLGA